MSNLEEEEEEEAGMDRGEQEGGEFRRWLLG